MQLDEWQVEIRRMKARAKYSEDRKKYFFFEQIDSLIKKRERVQRKLEKLKHSPRRSAWNNLQKDLEKSWEDLDKSMKFIEVKLT
mgnify:CR=1 FL=1